MTKRADLYRSRWVLMPDCLPINKTVKVAAALILLGWIWACSAKSDLKWIEDVRLPDGRVVQLHREVDFGGPNGQFGNSSTETRQSFEFKHPGTGAVVQWVNTLEQGRLHTVALWLDGDKTLLLAEPAYGDDSRKHACPNPPYLLFEHVSGAWTNKPLAQVGLVQIRPNLTRYPLTLRAEIVKKGYRLTAEEALDSRVDLTSGQRRVQYIVFDGMPIQVFNEDFCNYPSRLNYLLRVQ